MDSLHRKTTLELARDGLAAGDVLRLKLSSRSMAPLLEKDDKVVVRTVSPSELFRGDIVVFRQGSDLITHRLIGRRAGDWLTKGDRAMTLDAPVPPGDIVGLVMAVERNHRSSSLRTPIRLALSRALGWLGWQQAQRGSGWLKSAPVRICVRLLAYLSR